jgi:signal transduction histidine kinase/CheY-like chemotaxis protein
MGEQVYEREKQLKTQAQSLARQTEKLEEANVRLQELDKLKSAFLSSVSHELRTPLTSVLGFAKLIHRDFARAFLPVDGQDGSKKKRAERISKNLEIIQHEGERLTRLINDVLDLTKIESGRMSWNDRPVPAEELIKHAVNVVQGHFEDNPDVKLVLDVQEDLPQLLVDPDRMEQVLINLLNNAAKFTRRGEVRLQARRMEAGGVRISVTDSGPGIAPEDLDRIFDMFHQVQQRETGGEKPEGTGLGLAISRQIVNHYQGRLWAESETGQGSTFVVELPAPAEAEADAIEPAPAEAEAPMVLVVDDEPAIRSLLRQILEEEGCRVVTAHDGESALDKARSRPPDLVTMDIMMPGMSGKEVIERFREELELAHIPLLVVTILQDFRNSRADAALAKPIDEDKLVAAVHSLLQSPKAVRPMMALTPDGEADESACFTLCRGEISQCSESELWETVESGFRGTVIVPAWAADRVDLSRLAARENVQVVILPS